MALKSLKKKPPLADQAYTAIRSAIISNQLTPGEVLTEEALADMLGISRTPIRAALQRLLFEEIVRQQGKNMVVSDVTEQDVRDVNVVRIQLEPLSARLIGERGGLQAKQFQQLRQCNEKQCAAAAAGDGAAFLDADYAFHVNLSQHYGNSFLVDLVEKSNLVVKRFHTLVNTLEKHSVTAGNEHRQILDALEAQDYVHAEQAIRMHLQHVDERFFV